MTIDQIDKNCSFWTLYKAVFMAIVTGRLITLDDLKDIWSSSMEILYIIGGFLFYDCLFY